MLVSTVAIRYLEDTEYEIKESELSPRCYVGGVPIQKGQGLDGYGAKIATPRKIRLMGDWRWRRVYATCYSNVASHWVQIGQERLYLR